MGSLAQTVLGLNAVGRVTAQVGPVFKRQRGFAGVTRNGVGDYTLTLKNGLDFANGAGYAKVNIEAAAISGGVAIAYPTPTTIRVLTVNAAGAAAELDFNIEVTEIGPN